MAAIAPGPIIADIDAPCAAAVVAYTFGALNADTPSVATATSAAANVGVITNTTDTAGDGAGLVLTGKVVPLLVDANSTNIAVGDFIAPTTDGHGIKNSTNRTAYNAIALQAADADDATILVRVEYGVIHSA